MKFAVVIEKGPTSWGAYVPDLPGCVAAAETRDEAFKLIREAIEMHLELMREDGEMIPTPQSEADYVGVTLNDWSYRDHEFAESDNKRMHRSRRSGRFESRVNCRRPGDAERSERKDMSRR